MRVSFQSTVLSYFQEMRNFFTKRGKKEVIENIFRSFLWKRASNKKRKLLLTLIKAVLNSTPYVRLRTKKRGRNIKYKLEVVQIEWARRKALSAFSKSFKEHRSKSRDFFIALDKEFTLIESDKSQIRLNRDAYHKNAVKAAPYKWRSVLKKKEFEAKRLYIKNKAWEKRKKEWLKTLEQKKTKLTIKKSQLKKKVLNKSFFKKVSFKKVWLKTDFTKKSKSTKKKRMFSKKIK